MNNCSFYVLHLSDLHIRNESNKETYYSNSLKKLINDIDKQTRNLNNIIIVISGDIIDQGDYSSHRDAVILFFKDLQKKIAKRVYDIIIVPGNHDKHRDPINSLISIAHIKNGLSSEANIAQIEWEKHLEAYNDYFILQNKIREIFGVKETITNTFGTYIVNIEGINICFLRMDSSWCSYSSNDRRKLRIGEFQLSQLHKEYKDIKNQYERNNKSLDLTIAVSHYPLNWLNTEEEELCNSYFLTDRFLNVDVLMCGHVHDFSVLNYFNHEHSLLTLVTGIGWQAENPKEDRNIHRYSIYTFNLDYNSCDITMRKTKTNGDFDYDYSVYIGTTELKENKLRYPLKIKESASFIKVNKVELFGTQGLYVNKSILSLIPKVANSIASFSENVAHVFEKYKDNFLLCFEEEFTSKNGDFTLYNKIFDYIYEDADLSSEEKDKYLLTPSSFNDFLAFLSDICFSTVEELKDIFSKETFLRAYFRWHNYVENNNKTSTDLYSMLCQDSNLPEDQKRSTMKDVPWEGFIKAAFDSNEPVIFSANQQFNPIETSWDDFVTFIPRFYNSTHDIRIKKGSNERRPIITFGISLRNIKSNEDVLSLYILSYLRFDKIIGRIIDDYIRLFNIDAKTFISRAQDIKNRNKQ